MFEVIGRMFSYVEGYIEVIWLSELRYAPSVTVFEKTFLSIIRPAGKSGYGIHDPKGLSNSTLGLFQ